MVKRSLFKRILSVTLAAAMLIGGVTYTPSANVVQAAETTPLTTITKSAHIGGCSGGKYTVKMGMYTLTGAGTKFDKDKGNDNYFYTYFPTKGSTTVVVELSPHTTSSTGMFGVLARNGANATDVSAGVYYDYASGELRAGTHSSYQTITSISKLSDSVWIKLEAAAGAVYYTVANDSDFSDIIKSRTSMSVAGLSHTNVGFFATAGTKAEFDNIKISTQYKDAAGKTVKKVVYDSSTGELIPWYSDSDDYSGAYSDDFTFASWAEGNVLKWKSTRASGGDLGNLVAGKTVDYLLFPETNKNLTISADITINSIDSGTTKQGIAIGQFSEASAVLGSSRMACSVIQANKSSQTQHQYTSETGSTNGGSPKASGVTAGATYKLVYTRNADCTATLETYNSSGTLLKSGSVDLTYAYPLLYSDAWVQYGLAISAADVEIKNLKLIDSEGWIVYDQNDYYIEPGVAPVVNSITKTSLNSAGTAIDLVWTATGGSGNYSYDVMVSKDGGAYTLAANTSSTSYSYPVSQAGTYQFKIYGVTDGADSSSSAKISAKVTKKDVKNGIIYDSASGNYYYYVNDVIDTSYKGIVSQNDNWWYVEGGKVNLSFSGIISYSGGWWYLQNGKINFEFTGLVQNDGYWWYVNSGKVILDYTGIVSYNKAQWYVINGKVNTGYTGLVDNGGEWLYVQNGKVNTAFSGIVEQSGSKWYVIDGKLDSSYTGIRSNNGEFWYVVKGKINTDFVGLYNFADAWWYVKDGKIQTDYKGMIDYSGYTWYVASGKVDITFTGLGLHNGVWYCVQSGKVNMNYSGLVLNGGDWWNVTNGILDTSVTGIVETGGSRWLVGTGKLQKNFTGNYTYQGTVYKIVNGKVQ